MRKAAQLTQERDSSVRYVPVPGPSITMGLPLSLSADTRGSRDWALASRTKLKVEELIHSLLSRG